MDTKKRIHMYDDMYLGYDDKQYILSQKKVAKTTTKSQTKGDVSFEDKKFFTSLDSVMRFALNVFIKNNLDGKSEFHEVIQAIEEAKEQVTNLVRVDIEDLK